MQHAAAWIKLADVAGTWSIENAAKNWAGIDTVVNYELVATATREGWVTNFAGRDPIPTRVVAVRGDSVMIAAGPFETTDYMTVRTRATLHFKGDDVSGTMEARYFYPDFGSRPGGPGRVVKGNIKGTRKR